MAEPPKIEEEPASPKKKKDDKKSPKGKNKEKDANSSVIENPLPPLPGFELEFVKRRTNYTPEKLNNIHAKRINLMRMGKANVLFMTEDNPD